MMPESFTVSSEGDSGNLEAWNVIKPVLEIYADILEVDIIASNPHGRHHEPVDEPGKLHIFFWSVPVTDGDRSCKLDHVFGFELEGGQGDCYRPSGTGERIADSEGEVAAELVGGSLYVLFDLPHKTNNAAALMKAIMEKVASGKMSPEERALALRKFAERRRERTRAAWLEACSKRHARVLDKTRRKIAEIDRRVEEYQRMLVENIRAGNENRLLLDHMESRQSEFRERYTKEFDKIFEFPHVVNVEVDSEKILVFTDRIYCTHTDGRRFDIGDFLIELYTDGREGCVKMFNLTRRVDGYSRGMNAPHVFRDGTPCLGNLKQAIPAYIAEYEYAVVILLCIQFLESVDPEDPAGEHISNWPLVY